MRVFTYSEVRPKLARLPVRFATFNTPYKTTIPA